MKKKIKIIGVIAAITSIPFLICFAFAQGSFSEDYPGNGSETIVSLADAQVAQGARLYWRVYGHFPENWVTVEASGISEAELVGFQLEPINPDDPSLNFEGDVYYENNNGTAFVHVMNNRGEQKRTRVQMARTYTQVLGDFGEFVELTDEQQARIDEIINSEEQLLQFAMLGNFNRSVELFRSANNRFPNDLQEFMDSGFSPISSSTINPVTNSPFKFDGSPGDVRVAFSDDSASIRHVDEKGVKLPYFNYFF